MLHSTTSALPRSRSTRYGNICIIVAVSSIVLLGIVAVSVDGGLLFDRKSHVRATADAAALAAASRLYENYPADQGTDPNEFAALVAYTYASRNGYNAGSSDSDVTVRIPPTSGAYVGLPGYVEVIVTYYQSRGFSRIFGSSRIPVKARAVARGAWVAPGAGVIVLAYSGQATLSAQGNGAFTETGAPVIVNSNNPTAMVDTGNGIMKAPEFRITGGWTSSGNGQIITQPIANNILTGVHPTPDPLAYLPVPSQPTAGTLDRVEIGNGKFRYTLTPGAHWALPNFNTGDEVIFKQASAGNSGIYYLVSGGINSQGATLKMDSSTSGGMMLYNAGTGSNDKIKITGNPDGTVNIGPLTSGPYKGMTYFQNRTSEQELNIEGNGNFTIRGTIYAASAELQVAGNGTVSNIGSQYVTKELQLTGNGNINISWVGDEVARTRIITLVE